MATLYENYITGDDGSANTDSTNWDSQTFTPSITHIITSVKLKLWRTTTPGTVTVSIRATSAGLPTGADLASGTTDGDTLPTAAGSAEWREITLGAGTVLIASTKYAICVRAAAQYANWRYDQTSPTYAGGNRAFSSTSGVSWTAVAGTDFMFEDWGEPGNASPSVTTQAVSSITATTATGNGNVTVLGTPVATQHGVVWATHTNPTTADSKTEEGVPAATGAFTSNITSLVTNTLYYVKAYVINSVGTSYGSEVSFTASAAVPSVNTLLVQSIAATTAIGNGEIVSNGGSAITQHGVCWDTSADPTTADSKTMEGAKSVLGFFFSQLTSLSAGTLYHVRAYATNSTGTGYGTDVTFTTLVAGVPIVTTQPTTDVFSTTATGNGNIVDLGGAAVTQHGHCWSTTANPTTADSKTTNGTGSVGAFNSNITGLTAGTAYYVRAYATNSLGTAYGNNDLINSITTQVPPGTAPGITPGSIAVKDEHLVYISYTGLQRKLLGTEF